MFSFPYVETTSPLQPFSRVELTMQVGNLRIECRGAVTVKHPLVGMGIRFTEVSPINRDRLARLISRLDQESAQAASSGY
jgi:hypothetical protein